MNKILAICLLNVHILESLEREKYVSNIYTWKFGVTLLFMISAPE